MLLSIDIPNIIEIKEIFFEEVIQNLQAKEKYIFSSFTRTSFIRTYKS